MKNYKVFGVMALAAGLTACSDELVENAENSSVNGIPTIGNVSLTVGREVMQNEDGTRSIWAYTAATTTTPAKYEFKWGKGADQIGLSWLGTDGATVYAQADNKLMTNYVFDLQTVVDKIVNGYNNVTNNYTYFDELAKTNKDITSSEWVAAAGNAGYSGQFATSFNSLFKGDYFVYYPYNPALNAVGYLPVSVPNAIVNSNAAVQDQLDAIETVSLSNPVNLAGGANSDAIALQPYSSLLKFMPYKKKASEGGSNVDVDVKKIILYSNSGIETTQYVGSDKKTHATALKEAKTTSIAFASGEELAIISNDKDDAKSAFVSLLPQTLQNVVLYVQRKDNMWMKIAPGADLTIKTGVVTPLPVKIENSEFTMDLVTTDAEFKAAMAAGKVANVLENITVTGAVTCTAGAKVTTETGAVVTFKEATITGPMSVASAVKFEKAIPTDGGNSVAAIDVVENGSVEIVNTTVNAAGLINVNGAGTLTIDNAATLINAGGMKLVGQTATITNEGKLDNRNDVTVIKYNGNKFENKGIIIEAASPIAITGSIDNTGEYWKYVDDATYPNQFVQCLASDKYTKLITQSAVTLNAAAADKALNVAAAPMGKKDVELNHTMTTGTGTSFTLTGIGTLTVKAAQTIADGESINAATMVMDAAVTVSGTNKNSFGTLNVQGDITSTKALIFSGYAHGSFNTYYKKSGASYQEDQNATVSMNAIKTK